MVKKYILNEFHPSGSVYILVMFFFFGGDVYARFKECKNMYCFRWAGMRLDYQQKISTEQVETTGGESGEYKSF